MATAKLEKAEGHKKTKKHKKESAKDKQSEDGVKQDGKKDKSGFSLLADEKTVNPALSYLFAAQPTVLVRKPQTSSKSRKKEEVPESDSDQGIPETTIDIVEGASLANGDDSDVRASKRKRKRRPEGEEVEDAYMRRLAREEAKDEEAASLERGSKRRKELGEEPIANGDHTTHVEIDAESDQGAVETDADLEFDAALSPPPRHETEQAVDDELARAKNTVFLGNVSTSAISSKASRKILIDHLKSIFDTSPQPKEGDPKHKVESIRFRSTPYAAALPKKAAFAKREVMDATTKSTNAYAVYSSPALVREAVKQLNGSVVLDRHLRVDSVAHPTPVDNRRCVFVGNLGFVDDESNIQDANEEEGKETRKRSKHPADVEEGLWRTFGKCGKVESVRVIRDSATRVGKGIAYVQFEDGIAVEAALAFEGKKFPPMLPRKLRVSRAKAMKRNTKPRTGERAERPSANGYRRKITSEEASRAGRVGKLYGKAAASQMNRPLSNTGVKASTNGASLPGGIRKPETFVFEGHRASSKSGKAGLKLGKKKVGKPTNRSARRGAAFKVDGKKKR